MSVASSSSPIASKIPLTYWCHECDMSIQLVQPASVTVCPLCSLEELELMDDPSSCSSDPDCEFLQLDSPTFRSVLERGRPHEAFAEPSDDRSSAFALLVVGLASVRIGEGDDGLSLLPCGVCKDQFAIDEEVKGLPCRHLFHSDCIVPWISSGHDSCPLCRFQLVDSGN